MSRVTTDKPEGSPRPAETDLAGLVVEAISGLRFGGIHLTVHEGKLVQMEITEKRRFA
jgi:hypothetical protein